MKKKFIPAAVLSAALCLMSASMLPLSNAAFCMTSFAAGTDASGSGTSAIVISYDQLGTLLTSGNATLKKSVEDYNSNIQAYEQMRDILEWQRKNNDTQAASLQSAISRINKQLDNMTSDQSQRSLNKTIEAYTLTAKTLMNSYNQQLGNIAAAEKNAETASANYQTAVTRQSIGAMTATDVLSAQKNLTQAQNNVASQQQTAETTRLQLLSLLGIDSSSNVIIGTVPEPDLAAIAAINFESDKSKAIGNDSSVQSARHTNVSTSAERDRRNSSVTEAEGSAESDILSVYQDVLVQKNNYDAAISAFAAAQDTFNGIQLKKQAGMITNAEYLSGEAAYLTKKAARDAAAMNLVEAYETYVWKVEGVSAR